MTDIPFRKRTWNNWLISRNSWIVQVMRRSKACGACRCRRLSCHIGHSLISASLNRQTGPFRSSRKDPSPFPLQQQEDCTRFSRKKFPPQTRRDRGFRGMRRALAGFCHKLGNAGQRQLHSVPWRREGRRRAWRSISRRTSARRPVKRGGSRLPSPRAKPRKSVMPTPSSASV